MPRAAATPAAAATPNATAPASTPARRFHRNRTVRLHASGRWVCTIGRSWSARRGKLVDKDWYFTGAQADAVQRANATARQWELLCRNWDKTERPALEILGEPLPAEPRWPSTGVARPPSATAPTPEQLKDVQREGVIDERELAEAFVEFTFAELILPYGADRRRDVNEEQVELTTLAKETSQMRQLAKFLPAGIPAVQLRAEDFREAKSRMLRKYERRTVRNYLSAGTQLLRWLYGRHGGDDSRIPAGIDEAISLRQVSNLDITVHGTDELKELVGRTRGTMSQLDLMLALNCGMYQADIGRLRRDEIDLLEGSVFWDREKEPANPFRIHHLLWPETLVLVRAYLNDGAENEVFTDHRIRKGKPSRVNTRDLAFLDKHWRQPRYRVNPGGSPYDLVGRRWSALKTGVSFRNLRKSTSQLIASVVEAVKDPEGRAVVVEVVQQRFLGQKTTQLLRLYRTIGKSAYTQMNAYLAKVGDELRVGGVFSNLQH